MPFRVCVWHDVYPQICVEIFSRILIHMDARKRVASDILMHACIVRIVRTGFLKKNPNPNSSF